MLKTIFLFTSLLVPTLQAQVDVSKPIVVQPFESTVKGAPGFPEATRDAVIAYLKDDHLFTSVWTPEDAKDKDKSGLLEISATLSDFAPGNLATRALIGLGTGRAHATLDFVVKDGSGKIVWRKTIKETASFWANSASSSSQRQELPEKVAKALLKELQKARAR